MGKRIGIIAEYNPFHNGHLYQIQKAKELTGADTVIAVMSGNFTQRGDTSLINKFEKVKRKDFLKMQRQYLENMSGIIKMETGIDIDPNSSRKQLGFQPLETE